MNKNLFVKEMIFFEKIIFFPDHLMVAPWLFQKIEKIRASFSSNNFHIPPPVEPVAKFSFFNSVSWDDVRKILNLSPTKSCSLDPWPTCIVKRMC